MTNTFFIIISIIFILSISMQNKYNKLKNKTKNVKDISSKLKKLDKSTFNDSSKIFDTRKKIDLSKVKSSSPIHSKAEEQCRLILQSIYGIEFPPYNEFVINPKTGRWLTLDGYNSSLNIAFEYQGIQHYQYPNFLSKQGKMTKKQFLDGIYRDKLKVIACKNANIKLLVIPYTQNSKLEKYIKEQLQVT